MIIFITGGVRSGKSDFAQRLAEQRQGPRVYLATAQVLDDEMKDRIRNHQVKRGDRWDTLEEPVHLGRALQSAENAYETILLDCLTLWISNILFHASTGEAMLSDVTEIFFKSIDSFSKTLIVVSNEVGMGIVPDNYLARTYRDQLGYVNQRMAERADEVYLLVSGIPVKIKG
jgi:adenosylcobinamide kinase/adenosylcobinamide-phosphate guanylyltransferase